VSDFKPGDVVAHKSNPDRPWVVHPGTGETVYCSAVGVTGEPVEWEFPPAVLESYTAGVYDLFERLIAAVGTDRELAGVVGKIEDAHDEYMASGTNNNGGSDD